MMILMTIQKKKKKKFYNAEKNSGIEILLQYMRSSSVIRHDGLCPGMMHTGTGLKVQKGYSVHLNVILRSICNTTAYGIQQYT